MAMIDSVQSFLDYFEGIRRRTLHFIHAVPADKIDWQPKDGEYTCGDIIRHLAATEQMYVQVVMDGQWYYPGHEKQAGDTLDKLVDRLEKIHVQMVSRLKSLDNDELSHPRPSIIPQSTSIKAWRWLMAMAEHEVHHRSQLASYMMMMGVEPPQIFGLKVEELNDLAK